MNILKKYYIHIPIFALSIALIVVGLSSAGSSSEHAVVHAGALTNEDGAVTEQAPAVQAAPARRETTTAVQNPADPMVIVLSGEMGNGGAWSWDDMTNLLGVYGQYGVYSPVAVNGQTLNGVPLSYLLHYVRINDYASTFIVSNRSEENFSYSVSSLEQCAACVIASSPDNTLTLVLPGFEPAVITGLMRIEAYEGTPTGLTAQSLPADPQTISLMGRFDRSGDWTWTDLSNLLGVYSQYGAYVTVYVEDQAYEGVPVNYLFDYAKLNATANALVFYDRESDVTSAPAASLQASCTNCILALAADGTLSLVMPDHEPAVFEQLAAIEAR